MHREWGKNCQECGRKAYGSHVGSPPGSSWRVADNIWKAAGYKPSDVACKACLVKRLRKRFALKERSFHDVIRKRGELLSQ